MIESSVVKVSPFWTSRFLLWLLATTFSIVMLNTFSVLTVLRFSRPSFLSFLGTAFLITFWGHTKFRQRRNLGERSELYMLCYMTEQKARQSFRRKPQSASGDILSTIFRRRKIKHLKSSSIFHQSFDKQQVDLLLYELQNFWSCPSFIDLKEKM